jgi:hypothetical protein
MLGDILEFYTDDYMELSSLIANNCPKLESIYGISVTNNLHILNNFANLKLIDIYADNNIGKITKLNKLINLKKLIIYYYAEFPIIIDNYCFPNLSYLEFYFSINEYEYNDINLYIKPGCFPN